MTLADEIGERVSHSLNRAHQGPSGAGSLKSLLDTGYAIIDDFMGEKLAGSFLRVGGAV